jgi:hypothetical protein
MNGMQNKILFFVVAAALIGSLLFAYHRFYKTRNYMVVAHVSCEPTEESCFVWTCDSATETCSEDPTENTEYYKIIQKLAANVAVCAPGGASCEEELTCEPGEKNCKEILCSEAYLAANDEEAECSHGVVPAKNDPQLQGTNSNQIEEAE